MPSFLYSIKGINCWFRTIAKIIQTVVDTAMLDRPIGIVLSLT